MVHKDKQGANKLKNNSISLLINKIKTSCEVQILPINWALVGGKITWW